MTPSRLRPRLIAAASLALLLGGCAGPTEPPAGPGAASKSNLRPWLKTAARVTCTGRLQYFHCTSERGNYFTWSLSPAGAEDAMEIDVRACPADAVRLEDQYVTITGRAIPREPRHFPLLVAESIVPVPPGTPVDDRFAAAAGR